MNFALLGTDKDVAQGELEGAVLDFATQVKEIRQKYPTIGIGDTATDEAIVKETYEAIHYRG